MYASVRQAKIKPGTFDEIMARIDEELVDIVSEASGFVAYYIVDLGNDEFLIVHIGENEAVVEEATSVVLDWVRDNVSHLMAAPPTVSAGEVVIHAAQ